MKVCPKCNAEHNKLGTFCSRSCANTRTHSKETREKLSLSRKGIATRKTPITQEEIETRKAKVKAWALNKYQNTPFNELGAENRKRRVLEEQKGKCNRCGLFEWLGESLVLELEHKDGNNSNNDRSNLECLCPNCHSQTKTWRGRNNKKTSVSDDQLLKALAVNKTVSEALRSLGLADKGSNHSRAKKLLGKQ
jgi:arsenate reductase-like glutaredoxin family protein